MTADELYDGPFCVLSLVDNRTFQRLDYQVLDHDATQADVLAFFQRFQARLIARQLRVQAITTDGSALYPPAIAAVFGAIPHQVCQFHVLADLSAAVRHAVAHGRKSLAAHQPKRRRGRPAQHELPQVRQAQRLQAKIADLFTHRYLFVQRQLSPSERATLQRITRGLPHLRSLRATPAPSLTCVAAGKRQAVRCVSWTKSIACLHLGRRHRCSTAAAAPKPPWPSWPACAAGCSALRKSARPCGPSSRPMSRRR